MKDWIWKISKQGSFLQSKALLNEGFHHGFFTKEWKENDLTDQAYLLNPKASIHRVRQVHGSKIIRASQKSVYPWPEADGLVSDEKNQSLWIYTADCIPLLIADQQTGSVAAIHAGWRGIANGIIINSIRKLNSFGISTETIIFVLGPSINGVNYPVGMEILKLVHQSINDDLAIDIKDRVYNLISSGLVKRTNNEFKLDLKSCAVFQLNNAGVKSNQIHSCPLCTFKNEKKFNSWRRDQIKSRQWSGIANKS